MDVQICKTLQERRRANLAFHSCGARTGLCGTVLVPFHSELGLSGRHHHLKMKGALRQTSKLLKFHPFLDTKGLLRAGGRISQANFPFTKQHPILLPGNHVFTELLLTSEHRRLLHAGATLVSASLSQRFCILNGRRTIRSIVRR